MELCGTAQEWQCLQSTRSKLTLSQNSMSRGKRNRVVHLEKGEFRAWVIGPSNGER